MYLHKDGNVYNSTMNTITNTWDGYWDTQEQARDAYEAWVNGEDAYTAYERAMKIL